MAHARETLRDAAVTAITAAVAPGTIVKKSRAYAFDQAQLPAVIVYTPEQDIERHSMGGRLMSQLVIAVEAFVYALPDDVDDEVDALGVAIEPAMVGLTGTLESVLAKFESDFYDKGEKPVGFGRWTFTVMYITNETDPETISN